VKLKGDGNEREALCKTCCGLKEFYFLPRGHAQLTRRAGKYSTNKHVVVRWSSARKRYERQAILVEAEAIRLAAEELGIDYDLTDEDDDGDEE
jgi:hypothetical protein